MLERLLPRKDVFFDLFERHARLCVEAAGRLQAGRDATTDLGSAVRALEHEGDALVRTCLETLHRTFVPPLDRHAIHQLVRRLDDVLDHIDEAASRIVIYELSELPAQAMELVRVLAANTAAVERAVKALRELHEAGPLREACAQIGAYEHEADGIYTKAIAELFRHAEPVHIMKWRDVYDTLEGANDACQHVADVIEGIALEQS